ncbi:hypothetical protein [Chitinimonas koreensis]|nr:hypothetical protein [Chitinimonas koreensis]
MVIALYLDCTPAAWRASMAAAGFDSVRVRRLAGRVVLIASH